MNAITTVDMIWISIILAFPICLGIGWAIQSIISPPKRELLFRERLLRLLMFLEAGALLGLWVELFINYYI